MHPIDPSRTDARSTDRRPLASLRWLIGLTVVGATFATVSLAGAPSADGLFAGFFTSSGEFWCRLDYTRAPRTVANFVSLTEGSRDWIDFQEAKVVRRGFYSGLQFHRVIAGFMIQSGSPSGLGNDGPGYRFADEFHSELRHQAAGTLSMANSGPDSNGSQFFITVTNTPWLDGVHSVFGQVVEGMEVVHAISQVPTEADRPKDPVRLDEVRILRNGAGANSFDPALVVPSLPDAGTPVPVALTVTSSSLLLHLQARTNHLQHLFWTRDLRTWDYQTFRGRLTLIDASLLLNDERLFLRVLDGGYEP